MLSLVSALLVILTTGFWAFQGLFSAVIMFGEALLALMTAFAFYEPLAEYWKDSINPEVSEPGFLFVTFFITLIILRFLSDKYIAGTIRAHPIVDRVGGGVFGLFTGLTLVGVLLISAQMLPLGATTFGFERVNPKTGRVNTIWFNPDGFTVGLVNMLSDGRFAWGDARFETAKPDFLLDLTLRRAGTQIESRKTVPADAIELIGVSRVDSIKELEIKHEGAEIRRDTSKIAEKPNLASSYLVCRVAVKPSAAETADGQAKGSVVFTPAQFRITGPRPGVGGRSATPHVYYAVGMSDIYIPPPYDRGTGATPVKITEEDAAELVRLKWDTPLALNEERHKPLMQNGAFQIDVVFEVPSDTFEPWYIEFKKGARREVPADWKIERRATGGAADEAADSGDATTDSTAAAGAGDSGKAGGGSTSGRRVKPSGKADASGTAVASPKNGKSGTPGKADPKGKGKVTVGEAPKGRIHLVGAVEEGTGVIDDLPIPLPKSNSAVASKLQGDKFHDGHIVIDVPEKAVDGKEAVTKFDVPEGKKLVQIRVNRVFAGSMYGGAMEYAKNILAQYFLVADDGTKFWAKGVYTEATVDGKRVLELQYWFEPEQEERCLEPPMKLTPNILRLNPNFEFAYIFVVDPGVKIIRFHTSAKSGQDVTIEVPK